MLRRADRHGFTLPELMVSTVLMLIVGGAAYQLLVTTQRLARAQVEQVSLQSNVRSGALVVANELRELATTAGGTPDQNDIVRIASSDITYRAMRGLGFICQPPSTTQVRISRSSFSGYRDPQPIRDSAYVFIAGASGTGVDDAWVPLAISRVSSSGPCPGAAGPGITLTVSNATVLSGLVVGTPIRIYEVMQLKLYQSEGHSWLGARSVSGGEALQPVVGPLADDTGFRLDYLDGRGLPTADLTAIKNIRFTVQGVSAEAVRSGGGQPLRAEDGLTAQVALRNASWP
jgi:prepilin-type N-terminal cleavage/methylation domain-containing protein